MSSILDQLSQQIGQEQVNAMASRIGASPEQTQSAITAALPTLLGAASRMASSESGAAHMQQSLFDGQHGGMLDQITSMLGGGAGHAATGASAAAAPAGGMDIGSIGSSILGQLLGGKQSGVEQGIGKASGLNTSQISSLLAMLAPLLMGTVRKQQQAKNMDAGQLSDYLQGERKQVESAPGGSLIGRLLDQDGDGDFDFQDMVKFGMNKLFGKK